MQPIDTARVDVDRHWDMCHEVAQCRVAQGLGHCVEIECRGHEPPSTLSGQPSRVSSRVLEVRRLLGLGAETVKTDGREREYRQMRQPLLTPGGHHDELR